ncbi:MAG: penicillin-binding protein 2, partial [Thermomicrobiales bacterium]|nr:penicillin-binding protein 2 [Thermomicrobiales bacterium]
LDGAVPVEVIYQSSYVGDFSQNNTIPLIRETAGWRVVWSPSLIFASLGSNCVDYFADPVVRGAILDRNREPLAHDDTITQVGVIPGQIVDEARLLDTLSELLDMPKDEIKAKYEQGNDDWFMPIKDYPAAIDTQTLSGLQGLGGVVIQQGVSRVYPLGEVAAHVTGYVTRVTADDIAADTSGNLRPDQWVGRAGVEAAANDLLAGVPGGKLRVVDCGARVEQSVIAEKETVPGHDIILTIDIDLQTAVDAALDVDKGSAVILDPRNGEVLALVSHPTYDPNWFVLGFNQDDWDYVNDDAQRPLFNRAAEATYPTGSIFKVITAVAGMADLGYTIDSVIDCPGEFSLDGADQVWHDWIPGGQGSLTLHNAIVRSCNTVFYRLGAELDAQDENALPNMAKAFGLGAPTGIPELYEISGIVPNPDWKMENVGDFWARGDAVNLAIGQGYLVATPLQMANVYAALANGGTLYQPHLMLDIVRLDGSIAQKGEVKEIGKLPISAEQIEGIREALYDVVNASNGTAVEPFVGLDHSVSGKTGTEQTGTEGLGTNAWFAAYTPSDTPEIATIVFIEKGVAGSKAAAPVARKIIDAWYQFYP